MPWQVIEKNGKYCVAKEPSGSIIPGGCHDSREEAEDQVKALYASETEMQELEQEISIPIEHIKDMEEVIGLLKIAIDKLDIYHKDEIPDEYEYASTGNIALCDMAEALPEEPEMMEPIQYKWTGPITFEKTPTGDNRLFKAGSIVWDEDDLPIPFKWQRVSAEGHMQSLTIGVVSDIWRHPDNPSIVMAKGEILPVSPEAWEYITLLENGAAGGVSIDGDDASYTITNVYDEDGEIITGVYLEFDRLRIRALTAVDIPAFKDAQIILTAAAIGSTSLPMAERNQHWDGLAAQKGIFEWAKTEDGYDTTKLAKAFLWRDSNGNPQLKGSYKLPFTEVIEGVLMAIPKAIFAAASAMEGARGGVNIPESDKTAIRGKLKTLYSKIEGNPTPPFSSEKTDETIETIEDVAEFSKKHSNNNREMYDGEDTITAGGVPMNPPASWFAITEPDEPTPLTITDDGQFYAHLAIWDTCHIGMQGPCVTPPKKDDFSFFHLGEVMTDDGTAIATGHITFNMGHASIDSDALTASNHYAQQYDDTRTVGADVVASNGKHGIWLCGAIRPGLTEEDIRTLRGAPLSGDWRRIGNKLRLVASLSVNVPGFPVPRAKVLVASGEPEALIWSTIPQEFDEAQMSASQNMKNRIIKSVLSNRIEFSNKEGSRHRL